MSALVSVFGLCGPRECGLIVNVADGEAKWKRAKLQVMWVFDAGG